MYELFEDDRLRQKADEHFEAYYKSVLMELYNSGEDAIKEFLFGDEIKYIVSRMSESDCFWYSENGDLSEDGSMGIGLYPDELLYVGGWYDGMFDGNGKYYVLSDDGENYKPCYSGESTGTTLEMEVFPITPVSGRYIKLTCKGTSVGKWNSITEFAAYGPIVQ